MPDFIYLIHPYRHAFFENPTPEETAVMDEHVQYLKKAVEAGVVLLAGPCLDETFGVVILRAEDEVAAETLMFNDPAVNKNVMAAELHPLRISMINPDVLEKR
jgi:uncharacterized protein YciI